MLSYKIASVIVLYFLPMLIEKQNELWNTHYTIKIIDKYLGIIQYIKIRICPLWF